MPNKQSYTETRRRKTKLSAKMKRDRDGKLGMSCARVALEEKGSEEGTL